MDPGDDLESRFPWACQTRYPYWEVVEWVEDNIGTFDRDWYRYGRDIASGVTGWSPDLYRFAREQDAVLFQLRWS